MSNEFQSLMSKIMFLIWISTAVLADVDIVKKTEWNGLESKGELTRLSTPVSRVVIMHTAGVDCNTLETCSQQVRNLQHFHMESAGFDDIGQNFLVGNDGKVYEGRGWDFQGAFAKGYNAGSLGIAFIGTYQSMLPSQVAMDAAKLLIETGISLGKISNEYNLYGHRQLSSTVSPGNALYDAIKQWPHWSRQVV